MNGIDKIIARMEADTQAECADIAAHAAAEAEAILAQYRAEADKLLREGEARCKALEHEQVERLEGGSRLVCRQRVLAEKQRMLDEAFARAADALLKLPRPEYIDLLASLAAENGQGGEALVFSAADRDTVGQAVVDAANGKKPGAGFTLAADTRETGGGVVLQRGRPARRGGTRRGCGYFLKGAREWVRSSKSPARWWWRTAWRTPTWRTWCA